MKTFHARYLYHCTSSEHISYIAKEGLRPSEKTHWGEELEKRSLGRIFAALNPYDAAFYCLIIFKNELKMDGMAFHPLMLRFEPRAEDRFITDSMDLKSAYSEKCCIKPNRLKVYWHGKFRPLFNLRNILSSDMFYRKVRGGYVDWKEEKIGANVKEVVEKMPDFIGE
jgi:hypothetical protein